MATNELIAKLNELSELRRMAEELNAEIEGVQDAIKAHLTETDTDTITAGALRVTWKAVTSTLIDTAALRKELPEVWQEYGKNHDHAPFQRHDGEINAGATTTSLRQCRPKH